MLIQHFYIELLKSLYLCAVFTKVYDQCVCTFTYLSSLRKLRRGICLHSIVTFDSEACTPFSNSPIQAYYLPRAFCTIAFPQISIKALIFSVLNLATIALVKVYICNTKTHTYHCADSIWIHLSMWIESIQLQNQECSVDITKPV